MSGEFPQAVVILLIAGAAIVAITMHEAAHGFVAARLSDPTLAEHGRLSINPLRHLDLVGTLIVPAAILFLPTPSRFIFGWAKPVPIDPLKMGKPRRDMLLVAAAGPLTNIVLALGFALLQGLLEPAGLAAGIVAGVCSAMIFVNVLIALFNLIPLLPLDGGQVVLHLLPEKLAWRYKKLEPYGFAVILGVFFLLPLVSGWLDAAIDPFDAVVRPLVDGLVRHFETVTGASVIRLW